MANSLQSLLEDLHNVITHRTSGKGNEASSVVGDIVSLCQDLFTPSDLEYGSALLFSEEYGVLEFIKATIKLKEFENPKADLLSFLETYLDVVSDFIPQYAEAIKELCLVVLNRDVSSKVKIEGYNLLMKLLKSKNKDVQEKLGVSTLAEKLFSLCLQSSKQSSSGVRGAIFYTIGIIAERYPEHLTGKADRLSSIFLGTLKEQMVGVKKPDFLVIAGCLRGLTSYLVSFSKPFDESPNYAAELFGYIKTAVDPKLDLTRYEIPKAALSLLERHSFHFRQLITSNYQDIYDSLRVWSKHSNKEVKAPGVRALDACLYQISRCIVEMGKNAQSMSILTVFVKHFHEVLNSDSANIKELSMAIKGFGTFAQACKYLLGEEDLKLIFEEILLKSQHLFSSIENLTDSMQYFAGFLEPFSNVLQQISEVSKVNLSPIERMIVLLFDNYPKLGKGGMFMYEKGLAQFIRVLALKINVFKSFLSQIVYQGLIRTCSHPLVTEEGLSNESGTLDEEAHLSYQSYLDLWSALLSQKSYRDQTVLDDSTVPMVLAGCVYDELIQSVLLITKKLNLAVLNSLHVEPGTNISTKSADKIALQMSDESSPTAAKDVEIFINLVEFSREILLKCNPTSFHRWIPIFIKEIIILTSRYPFVSGFYKLMEMNAKICVKLDYFEHSIGDDTTPDEVRETYLLLSRFIKDVLGRIRQFKYDLLISCLQFLLHLPVQFVEENMSNFAKPIEMALTLGLSYDALAVAALDALEHWKTCISQSVLKPLLYEILPYFDGYLQAGSDKRGSDGGSEEIITISQSAHSRRNRVPIRLLKALRDSSKTSISPLMQMRYRMVNLLGDLGGSLNIGLVKGERIPDLSHAVTWGTAKQLSFALPFNDMKPTVHLDPFLPRVIELATTSSDRQTKVVACELLHALTLFVLGKSTQQTSQSSKQEGIIEIYSHIFPAVLELACDIEQVAEQLFRPLAFQMIHWFTSSSSKTESPDTMKLLNAILDGLVNQKNNALREFSAICIREFLEWSIKQSAGKLSKSAINPRALFKRIYSMAMHPNAYKRIGASSAFNSLYVVLREHEELVDNYILELLAYFIESLAIAHIDEPVIGTIEQSKQAIDHIGRIVKQKSGLLFKRNRLRRVPPVLQPMEPAEFTIDHMFVWLLRQCGSPKAECRHKCMELLYNLLPTQSGVSHARIWFENTLASDGPNFFVERFEGYGDVSGCSKLLPILGKPGSIVKVKDLVDWHEQFLAALDCYIWGSQLVKLEKYFTNSGSVMLECVSFFLKELACHDVESVMVHLLRAGIKSDHESITPMYKEKYNRIKCTAVIRTLDFLSSTFANDMWRNDTFANQRSRIFSDDFYLLVCRCLFHPESVGFNVTDIEILKNLPEQMHSLLLAMRKGLPMMSSFIAYMSSFLSKQRYDLAVYLPVDLRSNTLQSNTEHLKVQQLITGYKLLNRTGTLKDCKKQQDIDQLCAALFSNVVDELLPAIYDSKTTITPSQKNLADSLLLLALRLQAENGTIVKTLLDQRPVETTGGSNKVSTRGSVFYQFFKSAVNGHIFEFGGSTLAHIIRNVSENSLQAAIILQELFEFVAKQFGGSDTAGKTRQNVSMRAKILSNFMATSLLLQLNVEPGNDPNVQFVYSFVSLSLQILSIYFLLLVKWKTTINSISVLTPIDWLCEFQKDLILRAMIKEWISLKPLWKTEARREAKIVVINILRHLVTINAKITLESSGSNTSSPFGTYLMLLSDTTTGLPFKTQMFEMLPIIMDNVDGCQRSVLSDLLKKFIVKEFPVSSADLIIGTTIHSEYTTCTQQLFKCLAVSSSHFLLDVLLVVIVRETEDVYEKIIVPSLKLLSKRLSSEEAILSLDLCLSILFDEDNQSTDIRKGVTNRIVLVLLHNLESNPVKLFYVRSIKRIVEKCETRLPKQFDAAFEAHLVAKICCFKLIQTLFVTFAKDELAVKHSAIVQAVFPSSETGKELTQAITKASHSAKSEDCRGETMLLDLRREYHRSAYNALCAVIACTQAEQKFYTGFLFTENKIKGQLLWENIIDIDQKLTFEAEQTVPFARKKHLQMIRRMRVSTEEDDEFRAKGYVPYLSSQYLMESSLSEDVGKFEFSTPIQEYSTAAQRLRSQYARGAKYPLEDTAQDVALLPDDVLEMDEMNKNECMSTLVSLLKHMKDCRVYDYPSQGQEGQELPAWMNCLSKKFNANDTALNVKIFILKLLVNVPQVFEPYAKFWFPSIVRLIVSEQIPGDRLSYFIVDAIVVMLSWSSTCIPESSVLGKNLASSLFDYLVRNCHHSNRAVLKNNLQVIKTLASVWKDLLEINYKIIYDRFSCNDQNTKDNMTGIQILGALLASGLQPYCSNTDVLEEKYYSALTESLSCKYKEVFASAAEVIGMAMKVVTDNGNSVDCPIFMMTYEKLIDLSSLTIEKFVICLHRIQLNYSVIVDKFVMKLLYILPSLHGVLKQYCLETLASRVSSFDEPRKVFIQLKEMGLDTSINHRDEGVQLAAVNLINGLLRYLTTNETLPLLHSIVKLRNQSSVTLREKMYETFMWIFDTYRLDEQTSENRESLEILKLSKETLLLGINDKNTNISLKVLNFWQHETRLPNSTIERFIEILRALYSNRTEKEYLSYFTNLMLQLTSLSPDYCLPLFSEPLDSSKRFEEYDVNFSWQRQKIAMTPLFAASQIQSQMSSQESSYSIGMIRATQQSLQFSPTQQEPGTLNWMNPTFQIGSEGSSLSHTSPSQASMLLSSMELERKRNFNVGILRSGTQSHAQTESTKPEEKYDIMKLKKRIWKSKEKTSSFFAAKEKRSQKLRRIASQRQKAARDHKIVMYRKYRKGELPDIQIKHSELIVPLQAAAQCDSIIARELFKMLFDALTNELPDKLSESIVDQSYAEIQGAINGMMSDSVMFHPPFVFALEDACYRSENFKLDANVVAVASRTGSQQPVGIILLEKQLLDNKSVEPLQKRRRTEYSHGEDFLTWIELAKLYKSVDGYDFVHTIFSSEITRQETTRLALECEERNDFENALKYYNQLSSTVEWYGKEPRQEEEEFWDSARLMCYNNLARWSKLKTLTLQSIDDDSPADISKIWDDVHLQEQYLPYYIRSNMKLKCHGTDGLDAEQFDSFIDEALRNEERKEILESKFCDDLAFIKILQGNYGAAKHYISIAIRGFCEEWSTLSSLMKETRVNALSKLQKLYEMKEFTDLISREGYFDIATVKEMLSSWSRRQLDENVHPVAVWDDVMINRCTYLKKIKQKFGNAERSEELNDLIGDEQAKCLLKIADVARIQGNYAISSKYLRESYDWTARDQARDNGLTMYWFHVFSHVNREKARKSPLREAVSSLFTVLDQLQNLDSAAKSQISWSIQHRLHQSATLECLTEMISEQDISDVSNLISPHGDMFQKMFGTLPPMRKDSFFSFIDEHLYISLDSAVASSHQLSTEVPENRKLIETTLMTMVMFCDRRLKHIEESGARFARESEFANIVVRYLLKSLTLDSKDARLRFPRLLQIIDRYPETITLFSKKVKEVPTWMFLAWLNQIVALFDKTEGVFAVLSIIATDYPQALTYPLRISSDKFSFDDSLEGMRKKDELQRLLDLTHNPLCDDFISALEQLADPMHVFKDWSVDMLKLLKVKRRDADEIKRRFECIWNRLFQLADRSDRIKGDFQRKCSKDLSKSVREFFGKDGSNIADMPAKVFSDKVKEVTERLREIGRHQANLKTYSPWFASMQGSQGLIEVPGQYTGEKKPLPEYHVRIAGFDERVLVLSSLRKPKRIKIRGNDEKEYAFLVKGGEDLRLDQRIEQLFQIMNGILAKDPDCNSKALMLKTYQVIPLTTRVGLIEWVANSIPLKEMIASVYTDKERNFLEKADHPHQKYGQFVKSYSSSNDMISQYLDMFKKASYSEVVKSFAGIQALIPWDLLRRALDRLSASTEAYFVLRNHLIQTHSCLSVCHYILGIGDRHLENLMINKSTGGIIGIDFGYSFGISTTMLPIPELMPFRLTGQFRNLLLPLADLGPYRIPMTHVLRALRNDSQLLLNTMDIFVHEPLLDWQVNAQKQLNQLDETDTSLNWYPKEKISICKQKLKGINCAFITGEELRLRQNKGMKDFQEVAFGISQHNVRKRYLEKAESQGCISKCFLEPEEQVACLIDQATDFNVLGRTYAGWKPYI